MYQVQWRSLIRGSKHCRIDVGQLPSQNYLLLVACSTVGTAPSRVCTEVAYADRQIVLVVNRMYFVCFTPLVLCALPQSSVTTRVLLVPLLGISKYTTRPNIADRLALPTSSFHPAVDDLVFMSFPVAIHHEVPTKVAARDAGMVGPQAHHLSHS